MRTAVGTVLELDFLFFLSTLQTVGYAVYTAELHPSGGEWTKRTQRWQDNGSLPGVGDVLHLTAWSMVENRCATLRHLTA